MKKSWLVLGSVVAAFGLFVGVQAGRMARRRHAAARPAVARDSNATVQITTQEGDLVRVRQSALPPPPPRDYAAIEQLITDGRTFTYMDEILGARTGHVARWVDRRNDPIKVWVQSKARVKDFWPDYPALARDAFYTWSNAGIPVKFLFVDDSTGAEARLHWVDRFPDTAAGKTYWARDLNWWILGGDIEIALHSSTGAVYDRDAVHAIALHEVGHLIGLDHSSDQENIMAPRVHTLRLSPTDLRTAHLIYQLPPGSVRDATKP